MSLAESKRTYLVEQQFLGQRIAWCRYLERAQEARQVCGEHSVIHTGQSCQ